VPWPEPTPTRWRGSRIFPKRAAPVRAELARPNADIAERHKDELHALIARTNELESAARIVEQQKAHEIEHANRGVEVPAGEVHELRERKHELEPQMSKGGSCR
jgi:hypothetical protein